MRTSAPCAIDLSCIRQGSFLIRVTRDTLSTCAETARRISFRATCSYNFETSNKATSALLERFLVSGKAFSRKIYRMFVMLRQQV